MTHSSAGAEATPFDYSSVDGATAVRLRESADRIRRTSANVTAGIFDIAQRLDAAKAALPHGSFGPWLAAEFGWSARTAQRFTRIGRVLAANPPRVTHLSLRVVDRLAAKATPQSIRDAVLQAPHPVPEPEVVRLLDTVRQNVEPAGPSVSVVQEGRRSAGNQGVVRIAQIEPDDAHREAVGQCIAMAEAELSRCPEAKGALSRLIERMKTLRALGPNFNVTVQ